MGLVNRNYYEKSFIHCRSIAHRRVVIGGCIYLNSLMPIITGYAAKNLASAVFVSGRDAKTVEDLDLNFSFIRFNKNKVDYENKTVTSRFLWGKATAAYREGYGVWIMRTRRLRADSFGEKPLRPIEKVMESPYCVVPMPMTSSNRFVLSPMRTCL